MNQTYIFKMPDIGEGVVEAEITDWHIKVGDMVVEDAPIADAMTDKATVELTAPVSGKIISIGCEAGEVLAVGASLVVFEVVQGGTLSMQDETAPKPSAPIEIPPPTAPAPIPPKLSRNDKQQIKATPLARRMAKDQGIDLASLKPTGKSGQITKDDVLNHGSRLSTTPTQALAPQSPISKETTEIKIKGMRRIIAQRMSASKRHIPHFSYVEAIDMTALEQLRLHLNAVREPSQPKLTLLPFFIRALVMALPNWPQCNGTYDDEANIFTQHKGVHMGIATQTPNGLMVPVIHHAQDLDLWDVAHKIASLAIEAKSGSLTAHDLQGGTITLSSLGTLGGVVSTPVINRPQTAIICPNKIVETPVIIDGQIRIRKMMNLSSSFDHRIVDGFDAAQMIQSVKNTLENPDELYG